MLFACQQCIQTSSVIMTSIIHIALILIKLDLLKLDHEVDYFMSSVDQ
jgi:hypothetical protein